MYHKEKAPSTENLLTNVHAIISKHQLLRPKSTVIIGLSGGPDSMFLLHYLSLIQHTMNLHIIAAHLDHGWRENSSQDVSFCAEQCARYDIEFIHEHANNLTLQLEDKGSVEDRGRQLRRFFLEHVRAQHNADSIILGHHLDDQIETFLIRLIRGTTLTGLQSMLPRTGIYIRPLLSVHKHEILDYLEAHAIPYLIDSTNESPSFLRNRIRMHVVPALVQTDARFHNNFLTTLEHLQEAEDFLNTLTHETLEKVSILHQGYKALSLDALRLLDPFLRKRVLVIWLIQNLQGISLTITTTLVQEIMRFLLSSRGGTHSISPHWSLHKKSNRAYVRTHLSSRLPET